MNADSWSDSTPVIVGRPRTNAPPLGRDPETYPSDLRDVVTRELERYVPDVIAWLGYDFEHTDPSFLLPLGSVGSLDPETGGIAFGSG